MYKTDAVILGVVCFVTVRLLHILTSLQIFRPTGPHLKVKEDGTFTCVVCGNTLFKTDKKFDSGTGWPSFSDVANKSDSVVRVVDNSHGMVGEDHSMAVLGFLPPQQCLESPLASFPASSSSLEPRIHSLFLLSVRLKVRCSQKPAPNNTKMCWGR